MRWPNGGQTMKRLARPTENPQPDESGNREPFNNLELKGDY